MTPLAYAHEVVREFGALTAVDRVSLEVDSGEVVGLLGANGAGKTTFIRVLLGLLPPTAGQVALLGRRPSRESLRRVGYVPQGLGLYTDLTVTENLAFRASLFGVRVPPLTNDLEQVGGRAVGELPLGLQRRVAFAAALVHQPELLILDEPTSGVGPLGRAQLWDTIRAAAEGGAGVLVTTHHLDEAEQCDRLVMMASGRKVAEGSVSDIIGDRRVVEVVTGRWQQALSILTAAGFLVTLAGMSLRLPGGEREEVEAVLNAAGLSAQVETRPANLEETFVILAS